MNFRDEAVAVSALQQLIQTLALKGYELKSGVNNPLCPKNDRIFSAYLHEYHTDDQSITDVSFDILWKLMKEKQYSLEWVEGKTPKGVAAKQGHVERPKANMPTYGAQTATEQGKEAQAKLDALHAAIWESCLKETTSWQANTSGKSRVRQAEIKALIQGYKDRGEFHKAAECQTKIKELQKGWDD